MRVGQSQLSWCRAQLPFAMERRHRQYRQNAQNFAEMECKEFALLIGSMLAFAALNLVDFVTDILVLLKLTCVTDSSIKQECEYFNFTCEDGVFCSYANVTYTAGHSEDKCVVHLAWSLVCLEALGNSKLYSFNGSITPMSH